MYSRARQGRDRCGLRAAAGARLAPGTGHGGAGDRLRFSAIDPAARGVLDRARLQVLRADAARFHLVVGRRGTVRAWHADGLTWATSPVTVRAVTDEGGEGGEVTRVGRVSLVAVDTGRSDIVHEHLSFASAVAE